MSVEDRRKFYDEEIMAIFNKSSNAFIMKFLIDPFPKYLNFLIKKVFSKALFYYSYNSDIFSLHSAEYIETLLELRNHFKKIFGRLDLSEKSIENLIMFFLEENI
ncbi:hypothetical protein NBO_8g0015 [Nosema bombycis CQ1]|uniref:Uncharacterized protein n=1 Tax=Nosema bombycis (strain CQ1 / CVCC 102059) TaxID=578461 RepID=R0MLM5_NOSB1|nr:hypothetical protein NBO_8g0015 [Nosema bombycis CQ1]|eukprot:EOB15150.1 hypothetical protein NBO_8g0015 [Nosema bombycis CQ1]